MTPSAYSPFSFLSGKALASWFLTATAISRLGHKAMDRVERCKVPVVAAIGGACLGGGLELALACRARIAGSEKHVRLGLPEVQLGILPGMGGTQRLPRLVGIPKALEICLSGELYDAAECYRIGLVNQLVPYHQLIAAGEKMAQSFLKGAPLALRYIKEAIYKGSEMTLEQGLRYESDLQSMVMQTEDAKEGPRAFVEKRPANWKGR